MKKMLFIMPKFSLGGAEKSLLMLLLNLSKDKNAKIDLLLFKKEGELLKELPKNINVQEVDCTIKAAYSKFSFKNFVSIRGIILSIFRPFVTFFWDRLSKNYNESRQRRWVFFYKFFIKKNKKEYDTACAYLDGESLYYLIEKVRANKKIYFNQNDYGKIGNNPKIDEKYVKKVDSIVTLSEQCFKIFMDYFCFSKENIYVLPPLISVDYLKNKSLEYEPDFYGLKDYVKIVSVGRLVHQKGFDIAINAAYILKQKGIKFVWIIIGNGPLMAELCNQKSLLNLNDCVYFIGGLSNPYPYIRSCDVFVQSSRFEGRSVIISEAKALGKICVVTNYATACDQIKNMKNGIISEINAEDLAEKCVISTNKNVCCEILKGLSEESADLEYQAIEYKKILGL